MTKQEFIKQTILEIEEMYIEDVIKNLDIIDSISTPYTKPDSIHDWEEYGAGSYKNLNWWRGLAD